MNTYVDAEFVIDEDESEDSDSEDDEIKSMGSISSTQNREKGKYIA